MEGIIPEMVSYEELYETFLFCENGHRGENDYYEFVRDLSNNLFDLYNDLNNKSYKIGICKAFIKKRTTKREIFAFDFRDRIVCKLISNRIEGLLDKSFIDDNYAGREGKGTSYAIQKCKGYIEECSNDYKDDAYILKADLKSYFLSIDKNILFDRLSEFLKKESNWDKDTLEFNLWLINKIVFYKPQNHCIISDNINKWKDIPDEKSLLNKEGDIGVSCGNILIMWLSLFYLDDFDRYIKDTLGYKYYGRYMDDFYIVTKDKERLLSDIPKINEKLREIGTMIHPDKTYIQEVKKGVEFVGCIIKPHRIYIAKKTIKLIWQGCSKIENLLKYVRKDKEGIINHCICVINSYLGLLRDKDTYRLRKKIIHSKSLKNLWKYCYYDRHYDKIGWKKR